MSRYRKGDVILAKVRIGGKGSAKIRPAVVIDSAPGGDLLIFPVSHSPSWDQPSVPLSLTDFLDGGLDITDESYVLTGQSLKISTSAAIAKKGRLLGEIMETLPQVTGTERTFIATPADAKDLKKRQVY